MRRTAKEETNPGSAGVNCAVLNCAAVRKRGTAHATGDGIIPATPTESSGANDSEGALRVAECESGQGA